MKLTISGNANIQAHITRISEEYILLPETKMLAEFGSKMFPSYESYCLHQTLQGLIVFIFRTYIF